MARILNKEVRKKLEEMAINPAAVSGEEQGGNLLLYLSETLSDSHIMGFLKETEECLSVGYEDHGSGHGLVLKLRSDGFYVDSWREPTGERGDDKKTLIREIPKEFPNLTAEEYKSRLNTSLEHSIQISKEKYERLGKLFKKE